MLNDLRIEAYMTRYDNGAYSRIQFLAAVTSLVQLIQKSNRDKNGRYNQMNKLTPFGHCRCRDATILQSDFNITNTAILNVHSAPEPLKSPRICSNYLSDPRRFGGGATAPFAVY